MTTALFAFGCTQSPKSDEAKIADAQEVSTPVESATVYAIEKDKSTITWVGTKPTGRHDGTFPISAGNLQVTEGALVGGTIAIDLINVAVVDEEITDDSRQKLIGHLHSNDFFDVENHPEAQFIITAVTPIAAASDSDIVEAEEDTEFKLANPTHTVTGNLTLRNTTKSISFPAKINLSDDQVLAQAKFNIDRTDWGVSYGDESAVTDKAKDKFIHNKVNLGFNIQASK